VFSEHKALANVSEYEIAPPPLADATAFGVIVPPLNEFVLLVGVHVTVWFE
jgi:hypothetical protein